MKQITLNDCQHIFIVTAFDTLAPLSRVDAAEQIERLEQLGKEYSIAYSKNRDGWTAIIVQETGQQ